MAFSNNRWLWTLTWLTVMLRRRLVRKLKAMYTVCLDFIHHLPTGFTYFRFNLREKVLKLVFCEWVVEKYSMHVVWHCKNKNNVDISILLIFILIKLQGILMSLMLFFPEHFAVTPVDTFTRQLLKCSSDNKCCYKLCFSNKIGYTIKYDTK